MFMCAKGSGPVAGTIGPPTAFCSDALSLEPSSKHHGKTIKKAPPNLLLSVSFFPSLSFHLSSSLHPTLSITHSFFQSPLDDPHTRSSFCLIWSQVFKQVFSFHFHPEMALIKGTTWRLFIQNSSLESLGMGLSAARVIILQKDSFSGICKFCLFVFTRKDMRVRYYE